MSTEFKDINETAKYVYLMEDGVNYLFDLQLSGYLEKSCNIFIIGCRTSLRMRIMENVLMMLWNQMELIYIKETEKNRRISLFLFIGK